MRFFAAYSTPDVVAVGRWIAEHRRARGWSQRAFARACGINQSTISRLEAGKMPSITLMRLAGILRVLGWPPRDPN